MTIITALRQGDKTWLGHSNGSTIGETPVYETLNPWIFFGDWALGITGTSAQQSVLENEIKKLAESKSSAGNIASVIAQILVEQGNVGFDNELGARTFKIWCILANRDGDIFDLDSSMAVTPIPEGKLWARGSGTDYALGADTILATQTIEASERVRLATKAAIDCDLYCVGQPKIIAFE